MSHNNKGDIIYCEPAADRSAEIADHIEEIAAGSRCLIYSGEFRCAKPATDRRCGDRC